VKALVKQDSVTKWLGTRKVLLLIPLAFLVARMALIPVIQPERSAMECIEPPYDGCGFAFDEAHYIPAVRKMLYRAEVVNPEHPPLSKLLIMAGIRLLGDNPWGWRVPGTLLSTITVLLVGLIAYRVSRDVKLAMLSQTFAVTDVTFFNVSGLAILDPPFLTFTLISLYFLLERRMGLAGLFMGLAMLSKTSALIALLAAVAVDALHSYVKSHDLDAAVTKAKNSAIQIGMPALAVFLVGLGAFDLATGAFPTPLHHLSFMLDYHSNLRYFDPRQVELPLSWIIPPISRGPAPYFVVTVEPIRGAYYCFLGSVLTAVVEHLATDTISILQGQAIYRDEGACGEPRPAHSPAGVVGNQYGVIRLPSLHTEEMGLQLLLPTGLINHGGVITGGAEVGET
jgi:hypothetical protein